MAKDPDDRDFSHLSVLKGFRSSMFKESVSAREYRRGIQFAMEGYVSGVSVEEDSGGFLIRGTCFASFEKKKEEEDFSC